MHNKNDTLRGSYQYSTLLFHIFRLTNASAICPMVWYRGFTRISIEYLLPWSNHTFSSQYRQSAGLNSRSSRKDASPGWKTIKGFFTLQNRASTGRVGIKRNIPLDKRGKNVVSTPLGRSGKMSSSSAPSRPDDAGRLPRTRFSEPAEAGHIQPPRFPPAESLLWSLMANSRCAMALMGNSGCLRFSRGSDLCCRFSRPHRLKGHGAASSRLLVWIPPKRPRGSGSDPRGLQVRYCTEDLILLITSWAGRRNPQIPDWYL
jgi:hypothetical protein